MMKEVFAYMEKYRMIEAGDTVIAGVSGGADSVCLLFVLLKIREKIPFHLGVVHVNHGIREDAGKDADYVKSLCEQHEIPFYLIEEDVKAAAGELGISEEEAGRRIRYRAFEEALQKEMAKSGEEEAVKSEAGRSAKTGKIAVAHNANDCAETMLFHLFRGTGLSGMGGIKPVNGNIIRPLLCLNREQIEAFLVENGILWCTDSTNSGDDYTRNRIRHHILPFAKEHINKSAVEHMNKAAEDLQEAEAYIRKQVQEAQKRCLEKECVKLPLLLKEDSYLQGRIILSCIEELAPGRRDITAEHISNIKKLLLGEGSKEIHLPYGIVVEKSYDRLLFRKEISLQKNEKDGIDKDFREYDVSITGKMEIPGLGHVEISTFPSQKTENIPRKTYTKWFDYDKITASACFRTRRQGDYLTIDEKLRRKSLQDYFVNEKIPKKERDSFYVLADGAHIMWVPGYRISENYKVSEQTQTILEVRVIQDTEEERSHENG